MTNEEMERAIEFLVKSHADMDAQLAKSRAEMEVQLAKSRADIDTQLAKSRADMDAQLARTNKSMEILAETQTEFIQATLRHIETQGEINSSLRRTINDLARAQARADERFSQTDEDLNRLAALIERHISEGHNGKPS